MRQHPKFIALLQYLAFTAMITMNSLANSLPLNGYTTGAVSGFYPNFFVPAGFTFSIWGVIYLLLLLWVIGSGRQLWINVPGTVLQRHSLAVSSYFLLSSVLNGLWIVAWHYLYVTTSLFIMLALLATLIMAYKSLQQNKTVITGVNRFVYYLPFVVYLAWISVAAIANTTALLVHLQWAGWGLAPEAWSVVLIVIAVLLSGWFGLARGEIAYTFVTAWAFWGIYKGQSPVSQMVGYAALSACICVLAVGVYGWWRIKSKASINGVL